METDLIIGHHSIREAIQNTRREVVKLICTRDAIGKMGFDTRPLQDKMEIVSSHAVQEMAKKEYAQRGFTFTRVPGQAYLIATQLEPLQAKNVLDQCVKDEKIRIFCLDQVSDVNNAAAILRTAAFYNCPYVIISQKGSFSLSPSFFRIASGAAEVVRLVPVPSLSRFIGQLDDRGVDCVGFSEHAEGDCPEGSSKICLIMGSEEKGLSHAVMHRLKTLVSFKSQGRIKSLNVSVASAIAMDRFFS